MRLRKGEDKDRYYQMLTDAVNRKMREISEMDEKERDEYVDSVVNWILGMLDDVSNAMETGGAIKAGKVAAKYKEKLMDIDRRATAIACMTYVIKERWQERMSKLMIAILNMLF